MRFECDLIAHYTIGVYGRKFRTFYTRIYTTSYVQSTTVPCDSSFNTVSLRIKGSVEERILFLKEF